MAGYTSRKREPMGRDQLLAAVLAIVAGLLSLLFAAVVTRAALPLLDSLHGKVSPIAPVMWLVAATFLMRAHANTPGDRLSRRTLRLAALGFFLLGVAMMIAAAVL